MVCKTRTAVNSFSANAKAVLYKKVGSDRYGQPKFAKKGTHLIQIVEFDIEEKLSSIRVDHSASKSTIGEAVYDAIVLIGINVPIGLNDGLTIKNKLGTFNFKVAKISGVYDLFDGLVHYEIGLTRWEA